MIIFSLISIAVLTAVDQLIKLLIVTYLKPVGYKTLIDNLLELRYLENSGATFGMFQGNSLILAGISLIAIILILVISFKFKNHNFFTHFSTITIVAGGIGNLIDRVMFEYVIDYIHVMFFPYVFNFADSLVVLGAISLIIYVIFFEMKEQKKPPKELSMDEKLIKATPKEEEKTLENE
ncbi:MAG: signal peptidase II [Clostridia bacterium]